MCPGTLSKGSVDGRHHNSNLNIAFGFETFVPFNMSGLWRYQVKALKEREEQIHLSGCYTFDVLDVEKTLFWSVDLYLQH